MAKTQDLSSADRRVRAGQTVRTVLAALLVVSVAILAAANREKVSIDWIFGRTDAPLFAILLSAAAAGMLAGWLLHWRSSHRR